MKYILYKTTNLINGYIYIGVHKTAYPYQFDSYLGCGVRINKPSTYEKAKTLFQNAVKQFGPKNFRRETLSVYDTSEEAYYVEKLIVNEEFLARSDVYNMILGGIENHTKGHPVYEYDFQTGKLITEYKSCVEVAEMLGVKPQTVSNGIALNYRVCSRCFSHLKLDKIDTSVFENKLEAQKVYRYLITGEFDKEFSSLSEAGKNTLQTSAGYIQKATILGYAVKDLYYFSFYKESSYDKARSKQILNRPVHCYDEKGKYLKSYFTQQEAELDNKYCNITNSIKLRSKDINGHYWSLEKLPYYNIPVKREAKKVAMFNDEGKILKEWDSLNACAKEVGTAVKNVVSGKYSKHKGYVYKYI